jgi:hypothetical protein
MQITIRTPKMEEADAQFRAVHPRPSEYIGLNLEVLIGLIPH